MCTHGIVVHINKPVCVPRTVTMYCFDVTSRHKIGMCPIAVDASYAVVALYNGGNNDVKQQRAFQLTYI